MCAEVMISFPEPIFNDFEDYYIQQSIFLVKKGCFCHEPFVLSLIPHLISVFYLCKINAKMPKKIIKRKFGAVMYDCLCEDEQTFGGISGFLSLQHPVDSLALIGPEHRDKSFVLHVIGHLLAPCLVHMPDIIIELLHILPLQVSVTFFLLVFHHFYKENSRGK